MAKLVFLKILDGNFDEGFIVDMQIFDEFDNHRRLIADTKGKLPSSGRMLSYYNEWQDCYRKIVYQRNPRIAVQNQAVTNTEIITEIKKAKKNLHIHINEWLKPQGDFIGIWTSLLTHLKDDDEDIRVIIKTDDLQLKRLPFFLWDIFFEERYYRAEVGIDLQVKSTPKTNKKNTVKVLAILGSSPLDSGPTQIQISKDLEILKNVLSSESNAKVTYLKNPKYNELADMIEEQKPQILFFAGHSHTEDKDNIGRITLGETESITIEDLKYELIKAVKAGLQLAVFNSCDGIGIAHQLSKLHIPNIIVMREALPDKVAHLFLYHFLEEFVVGKPLNRAVRRARERLNRYEQDFPGVMSLPMIWQNSAEPTLTWESLGGIPRKKVSKQLIENNQVNSVETAESIYQLNTCVNCEHENSSGATQCEACFTPLKANKTLFQNSSKTPLFNESNQLNTCINCEHRNPSGAIQCEACFTLLKANKTLPQNSSKIPPLNEPNQLKICNNCNHKSSSESTQCEACFTPFEKNKIPPNNIAFDLFPNELNQLDYDHKSPEGTACSTSVEVDQTLQEDNLAAQYLNSSNRMNICSNCKHKNSFGAIQCESCGTNLLKSCNACGHLNANDSLFCASCGEQYDLIINTKDSSVIANRYSSLENIAENDFIKIVLAKDILLSGNIKRIVKKTKFISSTTSNFEKSKYFFETEARILEKLETCDQIQRNIAFFEDQNEFYLVQECIYGHKLSQEAKGRRISNENEVISILRSTLEILNSVHRNGVIHLNVKASNLIRRKKDGKLILVNFSAAREIPVNSNQTSREGTIGYMPVEHFLGNPQTSSDIYSLGMTVIQMITKVEPWNLHRLPDGEIEWQIHVKEKPVISNELSEILNKMIKFDFLKRYQSAEEVLADLNVFNNRPSENVLLQSRAVKIKTGGLLGQLFRGKQVNIPAPKTSNENDPI
jgi:ribosomal protein L40E